MDEQTDDQAPRFVALTTVVAAILFFVDWFVS